MFTLFKKKKKEVFYPLPIVSIQKETPNAVVVKLGIPPQLQHLFEHKAGQYIDIKHTINGSEFTRSYSIFSSSFVRDAIEILIKKIPDGKFSTFANQHLHENDTLLVSPPKGDFKLPIENNAQHYVAFVTGSGITPIMGMIHEIVHTPHSITILYGNKSEQDTLFKPSLDQFMYDYPEKVMVYYTMSQEYTRIYWNGRINEEQITRVIDQQHKKIDSFFLCGQYDMIHHTTETLKKRGYPQHIIRSELFFIPEKESTNHPSKNFTVSISIDQEEISINCSSSMYLLDSLLENGFDAPHGCRNGVCGKCRSKLISGKLDPRDTYALTEKEIKEDFIITCRSKPASDLTLRYV